MKGMLKKIGKEKFCNLPTLFFGHRTRNMTFFLALLRQLSYSYRLIFTILRFLYFKMLKESYNDVQLLEHFHITVVDNNVNLLSLSCMKYVSKSFRFCPFWLIWTSIWVKYEDVYIKMFVSLSIIHIVIVKDPLTPFCVHSFVYLYVVFSI